MKENTVKIEDTTGDNDEREMIGAYIKDYPEKYPVFSKFFIYENCKSIKLKKVFFEHFSFKTYTATIVGKNNGTNDKFSILTYTEKFNSWPQSLKTASKPEPHRGLGTRSPSPS